MWRPLVTTLSRFIHPIPVMLHRTWANGLMNMTVLTTAIYYEHKPFIHLYYILGIFFQWLMPCYEGWKVLVIKLTVNISPLVSQVLQHTWLVQHCKMLQQLPTLQNSWTCNMLSQELCTCTTSPPQPQDECMNKKWPEDYKHAGSWREIWEWPPRWVSTVLPHL